MTAYDYATTETALLKMGFRRTSKTSVRKDYGEDEDGRPYYIRLSRKTFVTNGMGPLPQEMVNDLKSVRFLLGM